MLQRRRKLHPLHEKGRIEPRDLPNGRLRGHGSSSEFIQCLERLAELEETISGLIDEPTQVRLFCPKDPPAIGKRLEPSTRFELVTFPLPRGCSTPELRRLGIWWRV